MVGTLNAVDMSAWGGEFTATEAKCMADMSIKLVIAGTGHPNSLGKWSAQHAEATLNAGMLLDGYRWLNFSEDVSPQMENAFESMGQYLDNVRIWWIDCEDTTVAGLSQRDILRKIQTAVDFVKLREFRVGIYTGQWWWKDPRYVGNSKQFKDLPLWNSYYDGDPDEDGMPYGGWAHSAIEQYNGTTIVCGQSVDPNYAKNIVPVPETGNMDELVLLVASVLAGNVDGAPFIDVDTALKVFRDLEFRDIRTLLGLEQTQVKLIKHEAKTIYPSGAHSSAD